MEEMVSSFSNAPANVRSLVEGGAIAKRSLGLRTSDEFHDRLAAAEPDYREIEEAARKRQARAFDTLIGAGRAQSIQRRNLLLPLRTISIWDYLIRHGDR